MSNITSVANSPDQGTNALPSVQVMAADGAISIPGADSTVVAVTKSSAACVMTLAAPTAGTDDYKVVTVLSNTAKAHTVTTPANKIQDGSGTTKDTATFAAQAGACFALMAYNGLWNLLYASNVTL